MITTITVIVHKVPITEQWVSSEIYCPNCQKREVWQSNDPGDYHNGECYICRDCGANFYIPYGIQVGHLDNYDQQRLEALRAIKE